MTSAGASTGDGVPDARKEEVIRVQLRRLREHLEAMNVPESTIRLRLAQAEQALRDGFPAAPTGLDVRAMTKAAFDRMAKTAREAGVPEPTLTEAWARLESTLEGEREALRP